MVQRWENLVFLHGAVEPDEVQKLLPAGLTVDTFPDVTGREMAWIGLVPFAMRGVRWRGIPGIPTATNFLEFNVRTYVHREGCDPGVWFFSLDAASRLAVVGARRFYSLPYFPSRMRVQTGKVLEYRAERFDQSKTGLELSLPMPTEKPIPATPGTLEFFLAERYRLYALRRGRLLTGLVAHTPYTLAPVPDWTLKETLVKAGTGLNITFTHGLFSPGVDVEVFGLTRC